MQPKKSERLTLMEIRSRRRLSLGGKRNSLIQEGLKLGCAAFVHWDDDDFYAPAYVETMVAALRNAPVVGMTKSSRRQKSF